MAVAPLLGSPSLQLAIRDGIALLTLNRPRQHNALSRELRRSLAAALEALGKDPAVRVIVLTGAGDRAFSVGLDLEELGAGVLPDNEIGPEAPMLRAFEAVRQPVIGAVNGFAVTGGLELALQCDLLVASTRACFADTHARVGVVSGWGMSQQLTAAIGPMRARYMHFTGNFVDADTAKEWGLVLDVVEPERLLAHCEALAREIAECDMPTLHSMREAARFAVRGTPGEGLRLEHKLARQSMLRFDPAAFERRRTALQQRGQKQSAAAARGHREV